jgi:hypothetical protein
MITLEIPSEATVMHAPVIVEVGELFGLQLLVARRADALARRLSMVTREIDRRLWLRAELEVFERAEVAHA